MISIVIDQLLKGNKLRDTIVRYAFWAFNGTISGILLHDILRILFGDFPNKKELEYAAGGVMGVSGFAYKPLAIYGDSINNLMLGSGFMIGTYWSCRSEERKPIMLTTNKESEVRRMSN